MFGSETLAEWLNQTGPIEARSPVVYALVRLATVLNRPKERALVLEQINAAGQELAQAHDAPRVLAFHRKEGPSWSIAEMAMRMTPEQWQRWMTELPGMAQLIVRPNAPGMEGVLLRSVTRAGLAMGRRQATARAMVLNANLTWTDDGHGEHTATVNGNARYRQTNRPRS